MTLLERDNQIARGVQIVLFRIDCNRYKTTICCAPRFAVLVERARDDNVYFLFSLATSACVKSCKNLKKGEEEEQNDPRPV